LVLLTFSLVITTSDYAANRALGKWVAKQREQYRAHKKGDHSFLTPDRLEQLNSVGFVWSMKGRTPKEEEASAIDDAAVAAAKAAVAAAVEAQDAEAIKQEEEYAAVAVAEAVMEEMGPPVDDETEHVTAGV
jgi:Helicase associated domain